MARDKKTERERPFPDPHPLIGHTYKFVSDTEEFYNSCAISDEDVLEVEMGPKVFRYVNSPELVNEILFEREDQFEKSEWFREQMRDFWGDALIIRDGERWRKQRKRLQPLFEFSRIESYTETFVQETRSTMDQWQRGKSYTLDRQMEQLSLRIILNFLFGRTLDRESEREVAEAFRHLTSKFDLGSIEAFLPKWIPVSTNRKYTRASNDLESEVETILRERKKRRTESTESESTDVVGKLLEEIDGGPTDLDEEVVKDEIMAFLFEHRTIASHLTFSLYLLAEHPEKRDRVREEIDRELGGEPPKFGDLRDLTYLDNVLSESLRLFPPVHTMFREPTRTVQLGDEHLDSDSILALSPYILHRNRDVYDEPNEFRPSRWDGESAEEIPHYAYFPFGGGPHHCIGMRLAETTARAIIATILQEYDVSLSGDGLDGLKFATPLGTRNDIDVTFS